MPELPEVEVVKRGLQKILKDQPVLERVELNRKDLREPMPLKALKKLEGQKILSVERRAKYLLFWMPQGAMISHLGMTGTWRVAAAGEERDHDHIYLHLSGGVRLAYRDPRRFGVFDYALDPWTHAKFKDLGPEPLSPVFTGEELWRRLRNRQVSLKVAIMDQKVVVGVGNIYASEALYTAGLRPTMSASKLSLEKAEILVKEIKKILTLSIKKGGSSISDFEQTNGRSGYFQNTFKVYNRAGEICTRCESLIKSQVLGGRNTFWCAHCQK